MLRHLTPLALILGLVPAVAEARCTGPGLLDQLPAGTEAELAERAAGMPFGTGRVWRVSGAGGESLLYGTIHSADPNIRIPMPVREAVAEARTVLVEVTTEEQARAEALMQTDPTSIMDMTGPGLQSRLSTKEWEAFTRNLQPFGIPPQIADRLKPWFAMTLVALPPCELAMAAGGAPAIDLRVEDLALDNGVAVKGLEEAAEVIGILDGLPPEDTLDMLRLALVTVDLADPTFITLVEFYEQGRIAEIWAMSQWMAEREVGLADAQRMADITEEALLVRRNRNWMPAIEAAIDAGDAVVAVGALHLGGEDGLLQLLTEAGYDVERLPVDGEARP